MLCFMGPIRVVMVWNGNASSMAVSEACV